MISSPNNSSVLSQTLGGQFDNSYTRLPATFYTRVLPTRVAQPEMVLFNHALAESLGLSPELANAPELFAGNVLPADADPIAQAYAGHQYGHFTMLGDGRAILLAEQITPTHRRVDIQLKGAGPTPYSRRGDGRAALGPMLREWIISEAMAALGIATTRSLAVVKTGELVMRESLQPGAVLTRVAASHLRVGTFQYAAAFASEDDQRKLVDYALQRHFPERMDSENKALALLEAVMDVQAHLIAQWQRVGFIHGVMNTDNMAICGETIDYGPCAFIDRYDPATVFSSIDQHGRYAYQNQPLIAQWNLARFAESLLPLIHPEKENAIALASEAVTQFEHRYQHAWLSEMASKLGIFTPQPEDRALINSLLTWMHLNRSDYTNTFRALSQDIVPQEAFFQSEAFKAWHLEWQHRLSDQPQSPDEARRLMQRVSPARIPRNHLVEAALTAAVIDDDLTPLTSLCAVLETPYQDLPEESPYLLPDTLEAPAYTTFCGT